MRCLPVPRYDRRPVVDGDVPFAARYGTAEQLRRRGFSADDVRALLKLRTDYEDHPRGHRDRARVRVPVDQSVAAWWRASTVTWCGCPGAGTNRTASGTPTP